VLHIPVLRWGKPYESLEQYEVIHFATGEPIAKVSKANGGIVSRDLKKAQNARDALRSIPVADLLDRVKQAADYYENDTLAIGDGQQSPDDFVHQQSASTGLPERLCRANIGKNAFVLRNMDRILDCLTRGLDLNILARGYGQEDRGVTVSYQAQTPILGAVLPSNSPGVHTLWLPAIPLQIGLALKPGTSEPWTPYRIVSAFIKAGIPEEAFSLYPGDHDAGSAIMSDCSRSMIFGSEKTVEQFKGNPKVQVHGPGFSKILIGDDVVDDWERYVDLIVESVYANSGRGCINASAIYAPRHTKEIAQALAERLGPIDVKPPTDPEAGLAAFTTPGMGAAVWSMIEEDLKEEGVTHMTAPYGPRLIEQERCAYLRPVVAHCTSPEQAIARKEFMFPFVSVVECPQEKMLSEVGYTLVCTALTSDPKWIGQLTDAVHLDRLNIGPVPTTRLNWLQPHEGNIIDFLFRSRAYQMEEIAVPVA
jgi:acyl-CoA reductase-like NAD-dependent aldehyde dehydrogenase